VWRVCSEQIATEPKTWILAELIFARAPVAVLIAGQTGWRKQRPLASERIVALERTTGHERSFWGLRIELVVPGLLWE
jgi:hypothetical protein